MPLEIAAFNVASALTAATSGADRIELCVNGHLGGTTPQLSDFKSLKRILKEKGIAIPIHVMIRPRGGDFVYSDDEIVEMEEALMEFMGLGEEDGPDGFVFGFLTKGGEIDVEICRRFIGLTKGRGCTFHRAFDEIEAGEREKAVGGIMDLGFKGILTSGGASDAVGGKEVLKDMVKRVEGSGCEIIVGGGVRALNLKELKKVVKAKWYHSSADVKGQGADEEEVKKMVSMTGMGS